MMDNEELILPHVLMSLNTAHTPTIDEVRAAAEIGVKIAPLLLNGAQVDKDRLIAKIMERISVNIGTTTVISEGDNHKEWLDAKRSSIDWAYWERYRKLQISKSLPPVVVENLHETTDTILSKLEDPEREGPWSTRGLVVGRVQSGKTANYIGLVSKAIDSGYKVIIVLAGMHNNLRSQTQLRMDEGIYGHSTVNSLATDDTETRPRIGVGRLAGAGVSLPLPLTTSADNGDFNRAFAQQTAGGIIGQVPIYLVIKKNKSILKNVIEWAKQIHADRDADGQHVIRGIPMLLLDDEADNASINTKYTETSDDDYDVSAINEKIRELLKLFEKSAYVGYTATPFANIYIPPEATHAQLGDDIFPRDFILNMTPPSNYIGPERVFGLSAEGDDEITPLPIVREVDDYLEAFPEKHKKDHVPFELPESMKEAINVFILGNAVRISRGQATSHSSMLIHGTRYVDVQSRVSELVREYVRELVNRLKYGDGTASSTESLFHELWNREYVHTLNRFSEDKDNYELIRNNESVDWSDVADNLYRAADKIRVSEINGKAKDVLEYDSHKEVGLSVIAIGADKLARGLTLEGLTVSYFLRASKLYDTLLQMGRWFGYRDGYLDVCRIYTTPELMAWYKHITQASVELFREFDEMAAGGATPRTFGLKVLTSENGLRVTALNKMRTAKEIYLSYSGRLVELATYDKLTDVRESNLSATRHFLKNIEDNFSRVEGGGSVVYENVRPDEVTSYLSRVRTPDDIRFNSAANGTRIEKYVSEQNKRGELTAWTVVLVSSRDSQYGAEDFDGRRVGRIKRSEQKGFAQSSHLMQLNKSKLLSPRDEYIYDFDKHLLAKAYDLTMKMYEEGLIKSNNPPIAPNTRAIRRVRPKEKGLLLLYLLAPEDSGPAYTGYVVSFPESDTAAGRRYAVNSTGQEQE